MFRRHERVAEVQGDTEYGRRKWMHDEMASKFREVVPESRFVQMHFSIPFPKKPKPHFVRDMRSEKSRSESTTDAMR